MNKYINTRNTKNFIKTCTKLNVDWNGMDASQPQAITS